MQSFLDCMACGTILLKPHAVHIHILLFFHNKFDYHMAISNCIFKEEQSKPICTANSDALYVHLFLNNYLQIFGTPNAIKMKMSLFAEDNPFRENSTCVFSRFQFLSRLNFVIISMQFFRYNLL